MVKLSNMVITILNMVTTLASLVAIGIFIYLHSMNKSPTHCQRMVEWPILIVGIILLVISLVGMIGSWCQISSLLWVYLVTLVAIILGWFIFSVFVFFVTNKGAGKVVSGVGYQEYRLGDYSHWLQNHVINDRNWNGIRSCLIQSRVCASLLDLPHDAKSSRDFIRANLSPIQAGCCKPPTNCELTDKNATQWEAAAASSAGEWECKKWSNDERKLCFDCKTCKAGVVANLRKEWRHFLVFNVIILAILFLIYMIACCAVRNNHRLLSKSHPFNA